MSTSYAWRTSDVENAFVFVSYDVLNLVTAQLGMSPLKFDALNLGISIDITMPAYDFLTGVKSFTVALLHGYL